MSRPLLYVATIALAALATACHTDPIEVNVGLAIANIDEVPEDGVFYSVEHDLYLADAGDQGLVALSRRDPFLGCTVGVVADDDDLGIELQPDTRFFDPCHGGQYDIGGRYLAGPGEEDLMRFPIEVVGDVVYLDPDSPRGT